MGEKMSEERAAEPEESGSLTGGQYVSRREFLKIAGIAGAAIGVGAGLGGLVAACGSEETTTTTTTAAPATTTTTGAESTTTVSAGPEAGREIKIGDPTAITGPLAVFGQAEKWSVDLAARTLGDGIVLGDGKNHKISIVVQDTQSDSNRTAQVTGDLILNEKVDMLVSAGTPDTVNPAADQAEALGCPLVSIYNPWQPYVFGRNRTLESVDKWAYGFFFGVEQEVVCQSMAFGKVPSNKKMGMLLANDADGNAWAQVLVPGMEASGYEVTFPQQYQPLSEDFTAQIAAFKKAGCELLSGTHLPPDFTNFWKQSLQQGFKPTLAFCGGKALTNFSYPESLGSTSIGLLAGWGFHRNFPYVDSLTGMTCQELCDDYEKFTGEQWAQAVGSHAKISWAVDVLQRAKNPEDKESIVEAILGTKMDLVIGILDFTQKVDPAGSRIAHNVCKTGWTCVQVVKGADAKPAPTTREYEVNIVGIEGHKVELFDPAPMQYA